MIAFATMFVAAASSTTALSNLYLAIGGAGFASAAATGGFVRWVYNRKANRDNTITEGAKNAVEALQGTMQSLQTELGHAQAEVDRLRQRELQLVQRIDQLEALVISGLKEGIARTAETLNTVSLENKQKLEILERISATQDAIMKKLEG